jgi:hypothetical protein
VLHHPGETFQGADGCEVCTCGFEAQVLCGPKACGDGGKLDTRPAADTAGDSSDAADVLPSANDAGAVDQSVDTASTDVPARSDAAGNIDANLADTRLASERG